MVHRRHRVSEANAEALWEGKLPPPPEPINWVRWHINFSIKLAITGICAFAIGVLIIIQLDVGDPQLTAEFHAQVSQEAYSWPMVAFITAFSLNFVTLLFERDSSKMQLALLACYINLLAAASDCLAWKGYAPIVRDVWGGGLQLVRVYMWLLTTPAMVYLLSIISDFRWQRVQLVMLADVTMLVFGIAADLAPSLPVAVVLYVIATCLFLFVMSEMAMMFEAAIADTQSVRGQHNLLVLKRVTVGLWFAFPATFMITKLGLVSLGMEEWMWTVGDFAGKVTFSCSLMYGNFLTIEQRRLIAMRIVEEGNRIQVIQELNDLVEQKERFMSSMSHELRTPLNGIIGLSEAVLVGSCGKLPEQAQKTVGTIKTSGARLLTLVNDILDAASMRVNKLVVKHERVNMHNLVNDVVELCQPLAKRAVTLVNAIDEGAAHVLGDTGRIIQVFHNLIGNSCKFTNAGSVTVSTATVGDFLEVSVSDTGIGIPESRFEQIFNAFEQVDMSTTRQYGGTGLGLNLVKQLVEAHGGTIRIATSKLGVGTTFTFQLWLWDARERARFPGEDRVAPPPAAAAAVSAATAAAAESAAAAAVAAKAKKGGWGGKGNDPAITAGWGGAAAAAPAVVPAITLQRQGSANGAELSPMPLRVNPRRLPMRFASTLGAAAKAPTARNRKIRVLSVDDDPVNQMVIESLLTPDQYEIMQAMDGLEALQMLDNARNEPPDIILLDVMMPGMSGYEVCSQLRKRDPYNCIPIIMVSAKSKEEHIVEGLAAGSNDYMVKPFGRLEILARIASHVRFRNSVYTAGAEDMSARTAQASVTLERISRIESQQYSLPPSLKSAVEGGQWSHVSPLPRPATLLVVRVANLDEIQNELLACEVFSAVSAFLVNAEPTLEKHGAYVISGLESRLMIACGLDGGAAAGAAGAAAGTEPVQQALALARDLQVLAATMVIDECVGLRLRLAIGIHQTSVADGAVVGVEYPHLQVVGSMAMEAASVEGLAAAGCITVSAPVQKALAGSVEFAPADDLGGHVGQVYLVKEGHWQEGLKEMPLLLKMLKERRDGAPNASAKRLGPVQLALLLLLRQIEPHKLLRSGGPRAQAQPGPGSADMPHAIQALAAAGESVFGRSTFGGIGRSSAGGTPHPHPFPAWGSHGGGSHGGSVAAARDAATLAEKALLESQLEEVSIECARLQQVVDELEARELAAKAALSARAAAAPPTPTSGGGGPETEALRARAAAFEEQAATLESQLDEAEGSLLAAHQEKRALAAELNAIRVAAGLVPGTNPRERRPVRGGLSIGSTLPRGGFNRFEVKLHTNSSSQLPYLPRDVSSLLFDAPGAAVGSPAYEHHRGGSGTGSGSACGRDSPALSTGTATIILVEGAAEIAAMLSSAGLAHLVPKFVSEDLTADMVLHLDDATLKQLGVASIGARMRLRAMCGGGGQSVQQ